VTASGQAEVRTWTSGRPTRRRGGRCSSDAGTDIGPRSAAKGPEAHSEWLDVALAEAIHSDEDVVGHAHGIDYGKWTRTIADAIERDYTADR
jgi:hypothetical protein